MPVPDELSWTDEERTMLTMQDAEARVNELGALEDQVRQAIERERAGPPSLVELEDAAAAAQTGLSRLDTELNGAKALARKRKREIGEWSVWFHSLAQSDRSSEHAVLDHETAWRLREVAEIEKGIAAMNADRLSAIKRLEDAKSAVAAFASGAHDKPLDEDPRMKALSAVRRAAVKALEDAKRAGAGTTGQYSLHEHGSEAR
jgi:hypothetical protein